MDLRVATNDDIPTLVKMGQLFAKESPIYRVRGFIPEKAAAHFDHVINGGGVIFLAEKNGVILGDLSEVLPRTGSLTTRLLLIMSSMLARMNAVKALHVHWLSALSSGPKKLAPIECSAVPAQWSILNTRSRCMNL
ncbi:hypothetical protein PYR73_05545 [Acinetobacter soli]|nr:hypothetical protein PYR73_05545 [Acinetobacter soli]